MPSMMGTNDNRVGYDNMKGGQLSLADTLNNDLLSAKKQSANQKNEQEPVVFDKLMKMLDGLGTSSSSSSAGFGADGGGSGTPAPVSYQSMAPGQSVDNSGAQAAAFGKAKAQAGAMGRASMTALSSEMANRGILGSGVQGRGITDRLAAATNPLSDVNVAQLGENTKINQHNQDLAATASGVDYQGKIAQRGQDVEANSAAASRALQAKLSQQQMLQSAIQGLMGHVSLSY